MKRKFLYAAVAALSLATISTLAIVKRFSEVEYVYLASNGKVVGGKTFFCGGGQSQWGIVTANRVSYRMPCN